LGHPVKDLDFAVEGDAPALARRLAGQLGGQVIVHRRFGTATVVRDGVRDGARVDLVTARREVYPRPGALPLVSPGSIRDDLARRDFSVNALALSLAEEQPRLLDLHSGTADLNRRLIRTLHPESFADDPTRLLRAVRYEQRLGFQLEPDTEAQVHAAVAQGCLDTVSGDRLRHELERILDEEQPGKVLMRAVELGILPAIHPALSRQDCLTRWDEAIAQIAPEGDVQPLAWLAALAYPLSLGDGEGVIRRLNMPNSWAQMARDTVEIRELESEIADPAQSKSQLCRLLDGREPPAIRVAAGLTDSPATRRNLLRYLNEIRQVAPILNGRDLLAIGVPPGPPVGKALAQLRAARLDGRVNNEVEEREWVREYVRTEAKGDW
jgi:tRNA nucleotidyltransferase (CCA-adding enzyme)